MTRVPSEELRQLPRCEPLFPVRPAQSCLGRKPPQMEPSLSARHRDALPLGDSHQVRKVLYLL